MRSLLADSLHDWRFNLFAGTASFSFAVAAEVSGVFPPVLIVLYGFVGGLFVALAVYNCVSDGSATLAES